MNNNERLIGMDSKQDAQRYARYLVAAGWTARLHESRRFGWAVITNRPVLNK